MATEQDLQNIPTHTPTKLSGQWYYRSRHSIWVLRIVDDPRHQAAQAAHMPAWAYYGETNPPATDSTMTPRDVVVFGALPPKETETCKCCEGKAGDSRDLKNCPRCHGTCEEPTHDKS